MHTLHDVRLVVNLDMLDVVDCTAAAAAAAAGDAVAAVDNADHCRRCCFGHRYNALLGPLAFWSDDDDVLHLHCLHR